MFSLQYPASFSPVYMNWIFCDSSFYYPEKKQTTTQPECKTFSAQVLIAPPSKQEERMTEQHFEESKSTKKQTPNQKWQTEDEEYTPGTSQNKKMKKNQQNENRNIIPNVVNQILSYIQKKNKSLNMTQKIFEKYNPKSEWSVKRFYLYQNMLKNKISHYVNEQTMRIFAKTDNIDVLVYSAEEQSFYNKVSRILVVHFLSSEAQTSTLTSKRMDKAKKAAHIEAQSQLTQKLKEIYKMH